MLWRFFSKFQEPSDDWAFPYRGLNYSVRQLPSNVTGPRLRNCHLIWALQSLAEVWYDEPISHEVAVALEIFDGDRQWNTIAWLYVRDSNVTSTSLEISDATATTLLSGVGLAIAPNDTTSRIRTHSPTPSFAIALPDANRRGLPAPNQHYIQPLRPLIIRSLKKLLMHGGTMTTRHNFLTSGRETWKWSPR